MFRSCIKPAAVTVLVSAILASASGPALSAERIPSGPEVGTVTRSLGDDRVYLSPIRFEPQSAKPGTVLRFPLRVQNTTRATVTLDLLAIPIDGSKDPDRFAEVGSPHSRSAVAVDWVSFPGTNDRLVVPAGQQVSFPASVAVPAGARPGTYALGFNVSQRVNVPSTNIADTASAQVRLAADLSSVAIIRVPGDAVSELRLRGLEAPRVVWGGNQPSFRVRATNVGDTDLLVDGKVDLSSFLSSAGRTLNMKGPEKGFPTLPGGERELVMKWSDPPLLGWFKPKLVVVGGKGSGVRITDNLDTVYVLPPWWLIALLVIAIWLPVRARRRRRGGDDWSESRRARAREKVEARLRKQEAMRRAEDARRRR